MVSVSTVSLASPSNSRDCATSISFAASLLALFLSNYSALFLLKLAFFFAWPRCNVGSQSGLASSYRYAGFPDMKCREQIWSFSRTRLSSRPTLDITARNPAHHSFVISYSCLPLWVTTLGILKKHLCHVQNILNSQSQQTTPYWSTVLCTQLYTNMTNGPFARDCDVTWKCSISRKSISSIIFLATKKHSKYPLAR